MPQHSTQFEAHGGGLVLSDAILIYRNHQAGGGRRADDAAFASVHAVEQDGDGAPTIAAGTPLTRAHLRQWTQALGRTAAPEILPANVLISHPDILAWWVPEQVRTAFFALSSPPDGMRTLSKRISVRVPYPAHLFIATRVGLSVFALGASERPTADTILLHSPILNVFVDGKLCWGSIARPRGLTVRSIPAFESAVFDSWSTHPNPGQELTVSGKGGLQKLWDDLATREAKRFPVNRLKRFGTIDRRNAARLDGPTAAGAITLGMLIAASARS